MKLFREDDFISLYKKIMKDGYNSYGAGEMWEPSTSCNDIVDIANEIFQKWLDKAPTVYGYIGTQASSWSSYKPDTFIQENITHSAKLVCIEEIKKECVEHVPEDGWFVMSYPSKCKHCGTYIKAKWEAVK